MSFWQIFICHFILNSLRMVPSFFLAFLVVIPYRALSATRILWSPSGRPQSIDSFFRVSLKWRTVAAHPQLLASAASRSLTSPLSSNRGALRALVCLGAGGYTCSNCHSSIQTNLFMMSGPAVGGAPSMSLIGGLSKLLVHVACLAIDYLVT